MAGPVVEVQEPVIIQRLGRDERPSRQVQPVEIQALGGDGRLGREAQPRSELVPSDQAVGIVNRGFQQPDCRT